MKKSCFITFEGPEGSGKSTQAALVVEHLKRRGIRVIHTREPGGTRVAETIRNLILDPGNTIAPLTELLLYEAARAQHAADVLLPALMKGIVVICDRYTDATLAYQGFARGIDQSIIRRLNAIATHGLIPDLTILLDITVEKGLKTARGLNKDSFSSSGDRMEQEAVSFHRKVRSGYLTLAKKEPRRIRVIKTQATIETTQALVIAVTEQLLKKKKIIPGR